MPSIENRRPLLQRLAEDASDAITDLIYEKVNQLLGAGDQLFTMEFPARPLNKNTYQYQADGTYSSMTKPITVQEAELLAETLEKNKQNMQACERHSWDGSGTVYPVQFSPADWFKRLEPNLHPKVLTMSSDNPKTEEDEVQSLLRLQNSEEAADSNFMDVILTSESIQKRREERSSASSLRQKTSEDDTSKIDIRFRLMKVSIDHGQWFSPNDFSYTVDNKQCSYQLPTFPTAFVIAKDITIRVKVTESEMQENKNYVELQNSSSGSLFGFRSGSESFYVGSGNDFICIRILGPQILGWFQQLAPQDVFEK